MGKYVWISTADETPRRGSGTRRVWLVKHPRKKGYFKIYDARQKSISHPDIVSAATLERITVGKTQ